MATRVRSYAKVNVGLAIGAPRPDGFHALTTLYQTLALHDFVTVSAKRAAATRIRLQSSDARVPCDERNTAWKMAEAALGELGLCAEVSIFIEKRLPVQGGMGAGSANAAAALLGLERELGVTLPQEERLRLAAGVGSDVPLFLVGGSVLGSDRGQVVAGVEDLTLDGNAEIACVVALPRVGVSTPAAFRDWDQRFASHPDDSGTDLHNPPVPDKIEELSRAYASVLYRPSEHGASGIFPEPMPASMTAQDTPEKQQGLSREQRHTGLFEQDESLLDQDESGFEDDLAASSLLALVRTGMENDFETVVFPQYPLLREIKRHLMGSAGTGNGPEGNAVYAALSGSGSALFGLYRSPADAGAAQQRLQQMGVEAIVTTTMPRARYWSEMFAE